MLAKPRDIPRQMSKDADERQYAAEMAETPSSSWAGRRILVVEDESFVASLVADLLEGHGFEVETAPGVQEARAAVADFDPDAAIIDVSLGPGPTGVDLANALARSSPHIGLMLLTRHPDLRTAGFSDNDIPDGCGFLRKEAVKEPGELISALEAVLTDQSDQVRSDSDPSRPFAQLSEKQLRVLRLLATGKTNEAIAREMNAGVSSVERWVASIFRDLDIATSGDINPRVEVVRRYVAAVGLPD